jgi:hypothetical protein
VVQEAKTLEEAREKSSGLITGLCAYFDHLIARPDREEQLPVYMGGWTRTELYVEPDVLKRVVKPGLKERSDRETTGPEGRRTERMVSEARDIGEDSLYWERDEESAKRVPWRSEWEPLLSSESAWRAVLLGPPGQGKSLLAEVTVRQIAEYAKNGLLNGQFRLDNVPLPIILLTGRSKQ